MPLRLLLVLAGLLALAPTPSAEAQERARIRTGPAPAEAAGLTFQYKNADIAQIVREVARATGEPFLFDDRLRGRITISVAGRVSKAEALELLHAALLVKGFAAVPAPGGMRKIIPIAETPAAAPWLQELPPEGRESPVTTLLRLELADVDGVVETLRPFTASSGLALAYRPTNSIVLAGSESQLHRWIGLAQALDEGALDELVILRLRYRSPADMVQMLTEILGEPGDGAVQMWPDERTYSLILRGPPEAIAEIRSTVRLLDTREVGTGMLQVIRVLHADPEQLTEMLQAMAAGSGEQGQGGESLEGREFTLALHRPTRSLVVAGDADTQQIVSDVVSALDRPQPQIGLEILVLEFESDGTLDLGFDAFIPLTDPKKPDDLIFSILSNPSGGGLLEPGFDQPVAGTARFARSPCSSPSWTLPEIHARSSSPGRPQ